MAGTRYETAPESGLIETLSDLTILAVDDSSQARKLLRATLTDLGVNQVYMAKDGKEALDFLSECENMINVIICDWNMPRVTGLEILRQVRTVDPDIPFLMVTGLADHESVRIAKADGVTGYLAKPYTPNDLKKKLNQILRILKIRRHRVVHRLMYEGS